MGKDKKDKKGKRDRKDKKGKGDKKDKKDKKGKKKNGRKGKVGGEMQASRDAVAEKGDLGRTRRDLGGLRGARRRFDRARRPIERQVALRRGLFLATEREKESDRYENSTHDSAHTAVEVRFPLG